MIPVESPTLFDIKQLFQADFYGSRPDTAWGALKAGFEGASGAVSVCA